MHAVILTGGKQYRVQVGDVLAIEKLGLEPGRKAQFDRVLLLEDGKDIQVGAPYLDKAMVLGLILENFKDEKVVVFKKKRRKQFRRTRGHRQQLTKVRITRIAPDRSLITAEDLAEEKTAPAEKPAPAPKAKAEKKPAPAEKRAGKPAEKPAKKQVKAKPAKKKEPAKPKADKKQAPAKTKRAKKKE